ncbi:MAG: hypothetical protein KGZ83_19665 [Sulfuricella sp.]|nr:hypothetical protein [Sulfuricella sp.]
MLAEWFTYLTTDCHPLARRYGYLRESIGIRARYRRCHAAWQPHLERSQAALLDSLDDCRKFRTALVFGSGLLLDIPLSQLSARFAEVRLIDIVHLPEIRRAARSYPNVTCIEHDVSGCLEHLADATPATLDDRAAPPTRFLDEKGIDWVASVNLLSQLPLLLREWLVKRFPDLSGAVLDGWEEKLMRRHLDYLAGFDATTCLLADTVQTTYDAAGNSLASTEFAARLGLTERIREEWRWDVAPLGEIAPGIGRFHQVAALSLT